MFVAQKMQPNYGPELDAERSMYMLYAWAALAVNTKSECHIDPDLTVTNSVNDRNDLYLSHSSLTKCAPG